MMFIRQKKAVFTCIAGLLVLILVSFISCQKELSLETNNSISTTPDFSTKVNSSVTGFVTDENENVVVGATVKAGSITTITDKYGYFEIRNVKLVKNTGVVSVSKPGYFKGIKTFVAVENKKVFFRIELISQINTGTIDALTGGTVTVAGGLSVSFTANAIINDADKTPYTGIVYVASYWIDPTGSNLNRMMPGDLRGTTTEGSTKMLATYGMAAVQLTGAFGELLQIAPDKKATLSFPLPASISGTAPLTIPLWYFDETNGLWQEQGTATKQGDNYVGDVTHFSFWNCDKPFANVVNFSCTIVDAIGHPLPNIEVVVYYENNHEYTGCYGLTDLAGYVSGAIPADAQLIVQVNSSSKCVGGTSYTTKFTTTNTNISLGTIILPNDRTIVLTGNAINCAAAPVKNGYVILYEKGQYSRYPLSNTGGFSIPLILCSNNPAITLSVEDKDALQQSVPVNLTSTTSTNLGTLKACGTSTAEFINFSIDGSLFSFASPDQFYHFSADSFATSSDDITGYNSSNNSSHAINISFTHSGIAVNSSQKLLEFKTTFGTDSLFVNSLVNVKITEYGEVGEFIGGNFSGNLNGMLPAQLPHAVFCTFRVNRQR